MNTKNIKSKKKYVYCYVALIFFLVVLLPLMATRIFHSVKTPSPGEGSVTIPSEIRLYRTASKTYDTLGFEEYVAGVVAAEMPESFEKEALKAQAVASRTYALGRVSAGRKLCDSVHCQAYREDNISRKVRKAVEETKGQILMYDGRLAASALYFSSSGGDTENSEDVFMTPQPYLVSVSSDYEPGATHRNEKKTMKLSHFSAQIKESFPELDFGIINESSIVIRSHSRGGRVDKIKVGNQTLTGTDIRKAFNLSSSRFKLSFDKRKITLISNGCGHGVGMSQYGANGMAKKGKSYLEILSHYYSHTEVKKAKNR